MDFASLLGGGGGGGGQYKSGNTSTATSGGPFGVNSPFNVGSGSASASSGGPAAGSNTMLYVVIGAFTAIVIAVLALK